MNTTPIPVTLGPGSQPVEGEDQMDFPPIPQGMATYRPPTLPEAAVVESRREALAAMAHLQAILDRPEAAGTVDILDLNDDDHWLVADILGTGEVSIRVEGQPSLRVQESIFAGVWRMEYLEGEDRVVSRSLEVGAVPASVRRRAFDEAMDSLGPTAGPPPAGVINAPAILTELEEHSRECRSGDPAHVVNLTLLPVSPGDLAYLQDRLGQGPVTMLSRGYGNCRITATALKNVWWVQYFNTMDTLILNTLEVVDVPEVARAAPEDLADSGRRLREVMETLA